MTEELYQKLQAGRKIYQAERTRKRLLFEKHLYYDGAAEVGELSKRELFLVGIALYWAEGFKHKDESSLGLATMDINMAKIYIRWLKECLNIEKVELSFRVTANIHYSENIGEMEEYWSQNLGVELSQFAKPFYQKTIQKKTYPNNDSYFGVLRIRVRKSINILRKMRGWIAGLAGVI